MKTNEEKFVCCICGIPHKGFGNNPWGAVWKDKDGNIVEPEFKDSDRCCDICDQTYVIPGRIYLMAKNRKK